jgi:hypothetical protein
MGVVQTRTTELAIDVNSNEVIQVAKCIANNTPERRESSKFFFEIFFNSGICEKVTIRNKGITDRVILAAAITRESASCCANRIKIADVDMLITPINKRKYLAGFVSENCIN